MRKILLVEDDLSLGESLNQRLSKDFEVSWHKTKNSALQALNNIKFDLLILDVGLPDGSGFEIAEGLSLREPNLATPIIFLTAQADAESRLQGYELGAKEYIPKPFHLKELLIRIEYVINAYSGPESLKLPTCEVFFGEMKVLRKTGEIEYPAMKDLRVLQLLIQRAPEPVSRDLILDEVWGPEKEINHRTIDNTIVRLKKMLGDDRELLIRSVRGLGYQWIYQEKG